MARVLVVDDHADTCRILSKLIRHMGHDAVGLTGGRAALEYLHGDGDGAGASARPDLVLLDVMMPDVCGLDVLRHVRADPRTGQLLVVMFSAAAEPHVREEAVRLGATDFWLKGDVDYARLKDWIDAYLPESQ